MCKINLKFKTPQASGEKKARTKKHDVSNSEPKMAMSKDG